MITLACAKRGFFCSSCLCFFVPVPSVRSLRSTVRRELLPTERLHGNQVRVERNAALYDWVLGYVLAAREEIQSKRLRGRFPIGRRALSQSGAFLNDGYCRPEVLAGIGLSTSNERNEVSVSSTTPIECDTPFHPSRCRSHPSQISSSSDHG